MRNWRTRTALGVGVLAAGLTLGARGVRAQEVTFDHLTCVNVSHDDRLAKMPPPLQLEPAQADFLSSNGCKIVGGGKIARAKEICYATAKRPNGPPSGENLSSQDFLCYRVKCMPNGGGKSTHELTDQFGSGSVTTNERPPLKKLCVPAFQVGATPTPTPAPTPTPIVTVTPTATPTATPPYGSASRAFVHPVASLLR